MRIANREAAAYVIASVIIPWIIPVGLEYCQIKGSICQLRLAKHQSQRIGSITMFGSVGHSRKVFRKRIHAGVIRVFTSE